MSARQYFAWRMFAEAQAADENYFSKRHEANLRKQVNNVFSKSATKFRKLYRLSKEAFYYLCDVLREDSDLKSSQRVSLETKVLCALLFYAKGDYQCVVGEANHFSQEAISCFVEEVTNALNKPEVVNKFIKFPTTRHERDLIKQRYVPFNNYFYALHGMPGVIGCIDGSHFKIFTPEKDVEHLYYCRKHYHSINVQMICDADTKILSINAKFGGAAHDAFIWENSNLNEYMQNLHQEETVWLLGDSGYPQRPWLMTPYSNPVPGSIQEIYNTKHVKTRVVIENTFGQLKNRWRCCINYRALHYKPTKCAKIIMACSVLHNLALDFGVPDPDDSENIGDEDNFTRNENVREIDEENHLLLGRALRDQVARRLVS